MIFSEGLCINEWKLRPLKKGTARLAFSSWEEGIELTVLPAGINYHSFTSFGKIVHINFGKPFNWKVFDCRKMDGTSVNDFNQKLKDELIPLVDHIEKKDSQTLKKKFGAKQKNVKKNVLHLPAFLGKWIHAPLYKPLQKWSWRKVGKNDHYDSVLVGLLFLTYPVYLIIVALTLYYCNAGWYCIVPFILFPFLAWSFIQLKKEF